MTDAHRATEAISFQSRVWAWMVGCFVRPDSKTPEQRAFRFLEEALELVQAVGTSREDALRLIEYVYSRPVGEIRQEIGGVMVTLAALSEATFTAMDGAGEAELKRCIRNTDKIRAKDLAKPERSPLPGFSAEPRAHPGADLGILYCVGCGTPPGTDRNTPICAAFDERGDDEEGASGHCAICGHHSECHELVFTDYAIRQFCGYLTAAIPELHQVHPDRVWRAWEGFLKKAQPETKTPKQPDPASCLHVWKVEGVRNPSPDQTCDRGCGYTWAQRCRDESAVECRWPDGCRLAGVCAKEGVCHGSLALNGDAK